MDTANYKVLVIGPDGPEFWTLDQIRGTTKPTEPPVILPVDPTPITPTPDVPVVSVAGTPRTLVGLKDGNRIWECSINGVTGLIQVVSENPDAFLSRGYNVDYTPIGAKPVGPSTTNYGNDPLFTTRPEGYRKRYFPGDGRQYWEQSDLPDEEVPVASVQEPVPVPTTPVVPVAPVVVPTPEEVLKPVVLEQIISTNSAVFTPVIDYRDGLAQILNKANPAVPPGQNLYVSVDGQPPRIGFSGEYTLRPGTLLTMMVYISASPDVVEFDPAKKSTATIRIGQPLTA